MTEPRLASLKTKKPQVVVETKSEEVKTEIVELVRAVEKEDVKPLEPTKAKPTKEQIARRNRRTRSPIDGRRNILTVKGLAPGMVGRWVDNTPERIDQLQEQGYEVVPPRDIQVGDISIDNAKNVGATITRRVGGGKEQILMQIPKEWYDADQKAKQKIAEEKETAIHGTGKQPGFYGDVKVADIIPGKRPIQRRVTDDE